MWNGGGTSVDVNDVLLSTYNTTGHMASLECHMHRFTGPNWLQFYRLSQNTTRANIDTIVLGIGGDTRPSQDGTKLSLYFSFYEVYFSTSKALSLLIS